MRTVKVSTLSRPLYAREEGLSAVQKSIDEGKNQIDREHSLVFRVVYGKMLKTSLPDNFSI